MSKPDNQEIEIKIDIQGVNNYNKLLEYLDVNISPIYHFNVFFDSEDKQLSKAGWAIRVRVLDDSGLITVKNRFANSEQNPPIGLAVRGEMEEVVSRREAVDLVSGKVNLLGYHSSPTDFIRNRFQISNLIKKVEFQNYRIRKQFSINQQLFFIELDKSIYSSQNIDYEVEIELSDESQYTLVVNWVQKLFSALSIPFKFQTRSKLERALDLMVKLT